MYKRPRHTAPIIFEQNNAAAASVTVTLLNRVAMHANRTFAIQTFSPPRLKFIAAPLGVGIYTYATKTFSVGPTSVNNALRPTATSLLGRHSLTPDLHTQAFLPHHQLLPRSVQIRRPAPMRGTRVSVILPPIAPFARRAPCILLWASPVFIVSAIHEFIVILLSIAFCASPPAFVMSNSSCIRAATLCPHLPLVLSLSDKSPALIGTSVLAILNKSWPLLLNLLAYPPTLSTPYSTSTNLILPIKLVAIFTLSTA